MAMRRVREWLAGGVAPPEDALLIFGSNHNALENVGALIDALTAEQSRISVVLVVDDIRYKETLERRFPKVIVRYLSLLMGPITQLALITLRVRAVLVVEADQVNGQMQRLLNGVIHRGVPVYGIGAAALIQEDFPADTLQPLSSVASPCKSSLTIETLAIFLIRAIGVERRSRWSVDTIASWLNTKLARPVVSRFFRPLVVKMSSIDVLRERLGNPNAILCLGNGPTASNSALQALTYTTLFRVNHQWLSEGYLAKPDMVFAGVKRSMRKLGSVPLGVANARKEIALIACRVFEPWHGKVSYTVVDEIAGDILPQAEDSQVRPTTGAYMIATAVALKPERLIIAGIDMFHHPDGAYSGTGQVINAYTPSHSRETDAAFISMCLEVYEGELVSYSPAVTNLVKGLKRSPRFTFLQAH